MAMEEAPLAWEIFVTEVVPRLDCYTLAVLDRTCKGLRGILHWATRELPLDLMFRTQREHLMRFTRLAALDLGPQALGWKRDEAVVAWVTACAPTLTRLEQLRSTLCAPELAMLTRLEHLEISDSDVTNEHIQGLVNLRILHASMAVRLTNAALWALTKLERLDIRSTDCWVDDSFPTLPRLTTLRVDQFNTSQRSRKDLEIATHEITRTLVRQSALTTLNVYCANNLDRAAAWILPLTNLRALAVSSWQNVGSYELVRGIAQSLPCLERLWLSHMATYNVLTLGTLRHLTWLALDGVTINLAQLAHLPHVETLSLMNVRYATEEILSPEDTRILLSGRSTYEYLSGRMNSVRTLVIHRSSAMVDNMFIRCFPMLTTLAVCENENITWRGSIVSLLSLKDLRLRQMDHIVNGEQAALAAWLAADPGRTLDDGSHYAFPTYFLYEAMCGLENDDMFV